MADNDPNRDKLAAIAGALGDLRREVAFVGGSVVGLLLTDKAAPAVRPTNDVDVIVALDKPTDYHLVLVPKLRALGFREPMSEVICRWVVNGLFVDIMPTDATTLGFTNRWYEGAAETATDCPLGNVTIRLVTPVYFIATKFEAFRDRGESDFAASHDFEDILAVVNGRPEIVDEVTRAPSDVRDYLIEQIAAVLHDPAFSNVLPGIVEKGRDQIVAARLRAMCAQ